MRNYKQTRWMKKRHFEEIAATLREEQPPDVEESERARWYSIVLAFADLCQRSNGDFNRDRFLRACGAHL